jgi:predicted dienelactone hydrolase
MLGSMKRVMSILPVLAACGSEPAPDLSVEAAGPYPVATASSTMTDPASGRSLLVQRWYPAVDAGDGFAVADFETDAERRAVFADLHAAAPAGCPTARTGAARDATMASGDFPLIVFSHCHECTRFSSFTVAERLASHGFRVAAVEHTDNTLWDWAAGTGVPLDADFLPVRAGDVRFAIDLLAGDGPVGVFGHSFGSVTAGRVAQDDDRVGAVLGIAAPMENPLLPGVAIAEIDVPVGFLVAVEDNSITELGNTFLRDNFTAAAGPAWKVEVPDAGHWSFSDLVGLEPFPAGCGDGVRQTNGDAFTYLAPETGREVAAAYVTAFFRATLQGDAGAEAYLTSGRLGVAGDAR